MVDSSSLDKALALAFSWALDSLATGTKAVQWLSFTTGVKPEVLLAGGAGLITFTLMLPLVVVSHRRGRQSPNERATQRAWPTPPSGPNKPPKAVSRATILSRTVAAPPRVDKERFAITDELRQQLHQKFTQASFEPNRTDAPRYEQDNPSHPWRAVRSSGTTLARTLLTRLTTQVAAVLHCAVSRVRSRLSSFSTARTTTGCAFGCAWDRVARKGWKDNVLSWFGRYPWQCQQCLRRVYFHFRTW